MELLIDLGSDIIQGSTLRISWIAKRTPVLRGMSYP